MTNSTPQTARLEGGAVPPFDRGFWAGRKGYAIGNIKTAGSAQHKPMEPGHGKVAPEYSYPADLRRSGPFTTSSTKTKMLAQKVTESLSGTDANQSTTVIYNKPLLQVDHFEPRTYAWRRTQKEPVVPRVHPSPVPVKCLDRKKGKETSKSENRRKLKTTMEPAAELATPGFLSEGQSSFVTDITPSPGINPSPLPKKVTTRTTSLVVPMAMVIGLLFLILSGYAYISQLAEQTAEQQLDLDRQRKVKLTESMLVTLGYDPGTVDGKVDLLLTEAVRAFQRDSLLEEDGLVSNKLVQELQAIVKIFRSG